MSREYPCIYFDQDGVCRKFSDNTAISYCVMGPCPHETLSNADRIRQMTDEELANFIPDWSHTTACKCNEHEFIGCDNQCEKFVLDWLQQPEEEDENE